MEVKGGAHQAAPKAHEPPTVEGYQIVMAQPNLSHLASFVAVARLRSFQRAAREMNLSTSAVSHAIRNLEGRLGVSLFNRTTRNVVLTEAGEHLLARLQPLLSHLEEAIDEIDAFRIQPAGRLRINMSPVIAHMVLVPLLARFLATFPEISLEIVDDDGFIDIAASGFDAGVRLPENIPDDMVAVSVGKSCRFAVVTTRTWLDGNGPLHHPNDLLAHECVRYRFSGGRRVKWKFEKGDERLEIDPKGRITVGDHDLALSAALDGIGPALLFEDVVRDALSTGRLVRVLEDWCPLFPGPMLYHPQQKRVSSALRALIEMVRHCEGGP
jgi:DNA-binding transcriptional LysR family regulator